MANTRSGGAQKDGTGDTGAGPSTRKVSAAAKAKDPKSTKTPTSSTSAKETRSSSACEARDTQTLNLRRSNRETRGKKPKVATAPRPAILSTPSSQKSARGSSSRDATPKSSAKKLKGVTESKGKASPARKSNKVNNNAVSASPVSNDSNGNSSPVATPKKTAKRQIDVQNLMKNKHDGTESGSRPLKKQKRLNTKSYKARFMPSEKKAKSPVLATSLRMDKEDASKVHMEDNGAVLEYEENDAQEQDNQARFSEGVNKFLEGYTSALREIPEVLLETDGLKIEVEQSDPISEPHKPFDLCSQNNAAESSPAMGAREQTAGYSNQSFVPESPNRPCSTIHSEEATKAIEDGDSIGIQGACTSRQAEAIQYDETECNEYMCIVCKSRETPGILKLCDGKGCKRQYHLSCLDPPLECVSVGIWLCTICTKKRIRFGVYSVSEGVESLWDVKEGVQNTKQYFVKYKNLAHVHNRWVPESNIISTPGGHDLVSKFSKRVQKEKTIRWRQEWAEPHRLLKKRSLMPPKEAEEFFNSLGDKFAYCNVEWLVKWKDLGYEHATWELETSSFLCTPEAEELKRSYENRHEAARKASDPAKINKVKQSPFQKLQRLPDGCPSGLDNDHLSSVNQLREFWHNSGGAIIVDDQERVIRTILFAMSILPDVCQPLLIVSSSASLSLWEAKFNRLAPSINVVVYNGEKGVRKSIHDLEFYENGSVMLQVLLSHPDAILEDIETIECFGWEAVLVDDCQSSRVSKCLEQLKRLTTNFRMVLLSSPLKENIPEYINLLSFLNSEGNDISSNSNGDSTDTAGTLAMLKAKLARYIAFERKTDSSKFLEYWVPARLSQVQLEMYCCTLLSNSPALRSHSKTDSVGALRDILVSLRKCCDHPYLVDQSLQVSLTKGHPVTDILDIGVHASGKLLLLDKMLQQIRNKGLRVLILSQSGGGAGNPMGDILDDFVRQRFGFASYERVERGLLVTKKQTSMNMFNDKTNGRFIFLIDTRACVPSIKLSSVDAIIIYGSDWNPVNDLRVLQRISIESQSERVPIFRLYSSCTVEEKALILAKHDHTLDSNIQNITPILSHSLLSWGASFLFSRLEEFKNHNYSSKDSDGNKLFLDNVFLEFLTKLSTKVEVSTKMNNSTISQAHLSGPSYSRDIVVVGEREGISALDGDLPKFWAFWLNLLDGRSPHWQHIPEPAQRSRRKIQNMEEQVKIPAEETDEARMKRRKIGESMDSSLKVLPGKDKNAMLPENNTPSSSHQISVDDTWQELGVENLQGTQKGLHVQLKPELSKLYKLLELPESVKCLCEEFLVYILRNHQVSQEPKGILHAFNIALCWRAASLLKHKVNHRESLALAVKHLKYECNEGLAEFVYDKLRILKKKFSRRASETSKQSQLTSVNNISPYQQETSTKLRNDESIPNQVISVDGNLENGLHQQAPRDFCIETMVSGEKELLSVPENHREQHLLKDELLNRIMEKRINLVDMVFSLREKNIHDKQANEISVLDMHRQKEAVKLREACKLVVEHLCRTHIDPEDRDEKIKLIIEWFTMLLYAFLEHMRCQHKKLEVQQSAVWTKELQLKEKFRKEAKSGQLDHTFDQHIPLPDSNFLMEEFIHFRDKVVCCRVDTAVLTNCSSLDDTSVMEITLVRSVVPSEVINAQAVRNGPAEVLIHTEGGSASEVVGLLENRTHNSSDGIDSQGGESLAVQYSLSSSSAIYNSINQESSSGDHRRTEHVEGESVVGPQPLQVGTGQHLGDATMEVNAGNSDTIADPPHLEPPTVAALPIQAALPTSREVETLTSLLIQSAQPSVAPARLPQGEAEQAGLSGVASALQHEMQPSTPVSITHLERTCPDQSQPSHQPEATPGSAQSAQLFPVASMMFNHPPVGSEPLKNELHRLQLHIDSLNKIHELKQSQLRIECNQEIEKIKRKYDLLLQEQDSTHLQQRKTFGDLYEKVLLNQSLAEDFRGKFISTSAAQARAQSPPIRRTPQAPQQISIRPSVVGSTASPIASSSAGRQPVLKHRVKPSQEDRPPSSSQVSHSSLPSSQVARPPPSIPGNLVRSTSPPFSHMPPLPSSQMSLSSSPSSQVVRPPPSIPGNLVKSTSAPFSHMPPPRGSYGVQSELARAPAPHLQFRPPQAHAMAPANHQQPPTRLEATSARTQLALMTPVNVRPSCSHAVPPVNSSPSSAHPFLPSTSVMSSSRPVLPANSFPSGPHPVPPATSFPLPSSSHPVLPATSLLSSSHPVLPATSLSAISHPILPASLLPSSSHPTHQVRPPLSSIPNATLQATAPPGLNTAPCISSSAWDAPLASSCAAPSMPDMQQSDTESASLDAYLTASLGLSSDPPGAGGRTDGDIDVVCLSDDESG